MKISLLLFVFFVLSACSTHVVVRENIDGYTGAGWVKDSAKGEGLKYSCSNFDIHFYLQKITQRNITNSIFWIAIIPTFSSPKSENEKLKIEINYVGRNGICNNNDVSLVLNKSTISPEKTVKENKDKLLCAYYWNITNKEFQDAKIKFSDIESCSIPDLVIKKGRKYSYENHFRPW